MAGTEELVVLLADDGTPIGTTAKATVHDADTPLHLAFSCFLHDDAGRVLMTRRALGKRTWPGVWTNSFCGHPGPGEPFARAIERRAREELGCEVSDITEVLPDFRYRAVDASGVVENEICPVFTASTVDEPRPNPDEVMELRWVTPEELATIASAGPWALSPWLVEQLGQLGAPGPQPSAGSGEG